MTQAGRAWSLGTARVQSQGSAPAQGLGHKNFPLLETNDPEMFQSIQDWLGKKTNSEIAITDILYCHFIYRAFVLYK